MPPTLLSHRICWKTLLLGVVLAWAPDLSTAQAADGARRPAATAGVPSTVEIDHVDRNKIYFKAGPGQSAPSPMRVDFYDAQPVGALHPDDNGLPYFLVTGKPCQTCPNDHAIYIIRPSSNSTTLPPTTYIYPGRILDRKTRALSVDSRAFYGHCLAKLGEVFVVFQKEQVDRRHGLQGSVLIAEPGDQHLDERLLERHLPPIDPTLRLVHAKVCHEIEGKNRISVPVSLGKPSDKLPTEEENDDSDEDEDDSTPATSPIAGAAVPATGAAVNTPVAIPAVNASAGHPSAPTASVTPSPTPVTAPTSSPTNTSANSPSSAPANPAPSASPSGALKF